jgi:hypothetical protein
MKALTMRQRLVLATCLPLLVLVMGLSLWFGLRAAWGDANSLSTRWLVSEWREGRGPNFNPDTWNKARDELRNTLKTTPGNAQLHDDLGFLNAARAQALGTTQPGSVIRNFQDKLLDEAIINYRTAAQLRPTFPFSWSYLAMAKELRGEQDTELWLAFDKALRFGNTESSVRTVLVYIACAHWATLSPERKASLLQMVASTPKDARARLMDIFTGKGIAPILPAAADSSR